MNTNGRVQTSQREQHGEAALFIQALDALPVGLAFFDFKEMPIHTNRPLSELLEHRPRGGELRQQIEYFVRSLSSLVGMRGFKEATVEELSTRGIRIGLDRYRLRGSYVGLNLFGSGSSLLVTLERLADTPAADEVLSERFGLTRQEVRIARLLAEGKSNADIAAEMFISPYTARNHTEHILHKLGVRSRAEVGPALLREKDG